MPNTPAKDVLYLDDSGDVLLLDDGSDYLLLQPPGRHLGTAQSPVVTPDVSAVQSPTNAHPVVVLGT